MITIKSGFLCIHESKDGTEVWVKGSSIEIVEPEKNGAFISLNQTLTDYYVQETAIDILEAIAESYKEMRRK